MEKNKYIVKKLDGAWRVVRAADKLPIGAPHPNKADASGWRDYFNAHGE